MTAKRKNSKPEWIDPDDAPEWASDVFDRAQIAIGGKVIRKAIGTLTKRGRPPVGEEPKQQVTLRLAPRVVRYFKDSGEGWQTRLNETLEDYVTSAVMADVRKRSVSFTKVAKEAQARAKTQQSDSSVLLRSAMTGKLSKPKASTARPKRAGTNKP